MTTYDNDHDQTRDDALPVTLRDALRALRTDAAPSAELWPGIASRLMHTLQPAPRTDHEVAQANDLLQADGRASALTFASAAAGASRSSVARETHLSTRRLRRWKLPAALAASIACAVAVGWQLQQWADPQPKTIGTALIAQEAEAMTRDYRVAFAAIDTQRLPLPQAQTIAHLDRSAADVRAALTHAPDSRLLFDQLKRVYALRLDLSQRFARIG